MDMQQLKKGMEQYTTIMEPDRNEKDWWAGAPSVLRLPDGTVLMALRMRDAIAPRGRRGYEIRLFESADGINFKKVKGISKEDAGINGFERPALVRVPSSRKIRLFGCGELEQGWCIWAMDDAKTLADINPSSLQVVLGPEQPDVEHVGSSTHHSTFEIQYKDPFITILDDTWHMFVIGFDRLERPYHFTSNDGITWEKEGKNPILANTGWHDFFTRPACLLPLEVGFLLVYEGSSLNWVDPGYNIATGLAFTLDLEIFHDLTPTEPLLKSTTPGTYHTWRYSHWMSSGDYLLVYFEAARENGSNETRLAKIPLNHVQDTVD